MCWTRMRQQWAVRRALREPLRPPIIAAAARAVRASAALRFWWGGGAERQERHPNASRILLIRPFHFSQNKEAMADNHMMRRPFLESPRSKEKYDRMADTALAEHDGLIAALKERGVEVLVYDNMNPETPDAAFCCNWITVHKPAEVGIFGNKVARVVIYPMALPSRRVEVRTDIIMEVARLNGGEAGLCEVMDIRGALGLMYLEGNGSMVIDRQQRTVYAVLSGRTYLMKLKEWAGRMGYACVFFHSSVAAGGHRMPVYHTNVLMSIGETWVVVCAEAISDGDRSRVMAVLERSGRRIVEITREQMDKFCANILEVTAANGARYVFMSAGARAAFTADQIAALGGESAVVAVPFETLERFGGGGVRCCLAEI